MSCDLSDPAITKAYEEIINGRDTDWLVDFFEHEHTYDSFEKEKITFIAYFYLFFFLGLCLDIMIQGIRFLYIQKVQVDLKSFEII